MENNQYHESLLEYYKKEIATYPNFIKFNDSAEQVVKKTIERCQKIILSKNESQHNQLAKLQKNMRLYIVDNVIDQLEELQNEEWFRTIDTVTMKLLVDFQDEPDECLWDRIVNINYTPLEQYCKKILQEEFRDFRGDAQEIVDFALLQAQKYSDTFDTNKYTSIRQWLQTTARNWALGHFRKPESGVIYLEDLLREKIDSDNSPIEPADTKHTGPVTAADREARSEVLNQALGKVLSTSTRKMVEDRFVGKSTIETIAKTRGTTVHKVRYRLKSAMQRLGSWLSGKI